jgi:glycerol dehydrogenase
MLRIMGFPGQYVQGANALQQLGTLLGKMGFRRPLALCGGTAAEQVWPMVCASLTAAGFEGHQMIFRGECTKAVIDALAGQAGECKPDVIVGLGGGKVVDAAKGIALRLGIEVVVCPTIASTDAPTTRIIVLYDDAHRMAGVEYLSCNPAAVVVDTQIIARAPARLFAAGIGDAISKKFEAAQCLATGRDNLIGTRQLQTAMLLAGATYETLLRHGPSAYQAIGRGELCEDVERVVEATVLLSGVASENSGVSLAHALTRGLTAVPAMAASLHGEQVAFGALVQLVAERRDEAEIAELVDLLCAVNLPVTFAQLGGNEPLGGREISVIVRSTIGSRPSNLMRPSIDAAQLEAALLAADAIGKAALKARA